MAETKVHTGAMLAVYPTDPSQLSSPTGDAPAELHLTLAYLGEAEDLSDATIEFVTGELLDRILAETYGPIEARISGAGTLGDKGAVVALVESEKIQELHDLASAQLESSPHTFPDPYPSFIPHVTIGYAPEGEPDVARRVLTDHAGSLIGREVTFDRVKVVSAGDVLAELVLTDEGIEMMPADNIDASVQELIEAPVAASGLEWYRRKRHLTLGLVAAPRRKFNPLLHPRGRDGRFIRKFGWIKWFADSQWMRGQVIDVDGNTGLLKVRGSDHKVNSVNPKVAITTRPEKARMRLPNLDTSDKDTSWKKVGGQGGSNKGGVFEVEDADKIRGRLPFNAVENALESRVGKDAMRGTNKDDQKYPDPESHAILQDVNGDIWRLDSDEIENLYTGDFIEEDALDDVSQSSRMAKVREIIDEGGQWVGVDSDATGNQERAVSYVTGQIWSMRNDTADVGDRFYVKKPQTEDHARNEVLANRLYELAGVPTPDVYLSEDASEVGSKILDDILPLSAATDAQLTKLREDFAVDAWLANWDVIGLVDDNVVVSKGTPQRIDAGGALLYRATGPAKGHMFGNEVGELETLRNPSINPNSAAIFSKISDEELQDGAERVAAIHPSEIRRAVDDLGMPDSLSDTLIARRADLLKKTGVDDPHAGKIPIKDAADLDQAEADEILKSALAEVQAPTADAMMDTLLDVDDSDSPGSVVKAILPGLEPQDQLDTPQQAADVPDAPEDIPDVPEVDPDVDLAVHSAQDAGDVFTLMSTANSAIQVEETLPLELVHYDSDLVDIYVGRSVLIEHSSYKPPLVGVLNKNSDGTYSVLNGLDGAKEHVLGENWTPDDWSTSQMHILKMTPSTTLGVGTPEFVKTGTDVGDVELNGVKIGTYKYNYWPGNKSKHGYRATISPEYTTSGQTVITPYAGVKSYLYDHITDRIWPESLVPIISKPKTDGSELAKNLEAKQATKSVAKSSAGQMLLSDGNPVTVGTKVKSTTDGYTGEIISWPNQEKHKGLVYVKGEDGSKKYRSLSKLKLDDTVPAPAQSAEPGYVSPYAHLKTADGKTPALGQKVKAGKAGKEVEGTLVKVNPKNGWVYIQGADGTKHPPKTVGTMHVLDESGVGLPLAAQAAMPQAKKSSKKPEAKTPGNKIAYPGPDGATITQDPAMVEKYLGGHSSRTLTKDGYAPYTGMIVRDSKGNAGIVTKVEPTYGSMPSYVTVAFDDPYKGIAKKKRSTKTLTADHGAMLTTADGSPLVAISEIDFPEGPGIYFNPLKDLPNGTIVYKHPTSDAERFVAVTQTGKVVSFKSSFASVDDTIAATWMPNMKPVAVIDSGSENSLHLSVAKNSRSYQYNLSSKIGDKNKTYAQIVSDEILASKPDAPTSDGALPEASTLPPPISLGHSGALSTAFPAPKNAPLSSVDDGPGLPPITGATPDLESKPSFLGSTNANSILEAATTTLTKNYSTEAGTGASYGLGDADHVEDMLFRFQIIRGSDGKDYLESRFRLREDYSEDLADRLLVNQSSKKGAWADAETVSVTNLVEGDMISVRQGANGRYKPGNMTTPVNATVSEVSPPLAISPANFPIHRVTFFTADGSLAEMDLENRGSPSIATYKWDADAVPKGTQKNFVIRDEAAADGWAGQLGRIALELSSWNGTEPDSTGASTSDLDLTNPKGVEIITGGGTLSRTLDDGTSVTVRLAHRDEGTTDPRTVRRANITGEVKVRVPIEDELADEVLAETLGRAYESVGLTPDIQGPPSDEQVALFAMNKVVTNFSSTFEYRGAPVTSLQDPRIDKVLKRMATELGVEVTRDDILIDTTSVGGVRPVWSKRVAQAMTKKQNIDYFYHSGDSSNFGQILAGTHSGLLSSDERFSLGNMYEGQSSVTDMRIGSGDRLYVRARRGKKVISNQGLVLHPTAINSRMDVYANASDKYGERSISNSHMTFGGTDSGNERMIKRRIEPEDIAYAVYSSATERDNALNELKKRGITHIGKRTIDSVLVSESAYHQLHAGSSAADNVWDEAEDNINVGAVPLPVSTSPGPGTPTPSPATPTPPESITPTEPTPAADGTPAVDPGFIM